MTIVAHRYSTRHGLSGRSTTLSEAEARDAIRHAGDVRPETTASGRRPAISPMLVAVYPLANVCLACPELARAGCGTGYCRVGPIPRNYPTLIQLIQDAACPIGKHQAMKDHSHADQESPTRLLP